MPVPSVSITTSEAPPPAPNRASASTAQLASLSTTTGRPRRSDITSANGTPDSGRCVEYAAVPVRRSSVTGMPKPTASTSSSVAARASSTAATIVAISVAWSRPKA